MRQVLFVQGAGAGTHADWDSALVTSLRGALGSSWEVRYPRMPDEDRPRAAAWGEAISAELSLLGARPVLVGHSVGATVLVETLVSRPAPCAPAALVLIGAPFMGGGGWPGEELEVPVDLGARLPTGVPLHVVHGTADEVVPCSHAHLWAAVAPRAQVHLLPGRDHQLGDDLTDVAVLIQHLGW